MPDLRASTSEGETFDDPSEDALFMLFEDLDDPANPTDWFVVDDLSAGVADRYARVAINDGTLQLEHRAGDAASHRHAFTSDMRAAHEWLTSWAFSAAPAPVVALDWQRGSPE